NRIVENILISGRLLHMKPNDEYRLGNELRDWASVPIKNRFHKLLVSNAASDLKARFIRCLARDETDGGMPGIYFETYVNYIFRSAEDTFKRRRLGEAKEPYSEDYT